MLAGTFVRLLITGLLVCCTLSGRKNGDVDKDVFDGTRIAGTTDACIFTLRSGNFAIGTVMYKSIHVV